MGNKSPHIYSLECWHSRSSSNLWGLGSKTDPFCMGRQQALDGNKKRNSQKLVGGRGLLRSRVATRIHIVNSIRALQSIDFSRMTIVRNGRNKRNSHLHFFWKLFVAADACLCFEVRALSWFCLSCGFILQTNSMACFGNLRFLFPSRAAVF